MNQRFEEDFNELGNIYEAYFAKPAGGQRDLAQGSPSYKKSYMQPGGTNQYAMNAMNGPVPVSDEESNPVLDKINALIAEAENNGQAYALHQLTDLKAFIKKQG